MDISLYAWNTICLMFTLLMTVYSQLLYESSTQWDSEFNRDTDKFVIQSTLHVTETILKNTQSELEVLKANALSVSVSYDELLKMFNKRELPTGTFKFYYYITSSYTWSCYQITHLILELKSLKEKCMNNLT